MGARVKAVRQPERVLRTISGEVWAIQPDWLQSIWRIAQGGGDLEAAAHRRAQLAEDEFETTAEMTIQDGVARIPLFGPTFPRANLMTELSGATSLRHFAMQLAQALEREDVRQILLEVDSPGGVVPGVDETAQLIAEANARKPVTAYVVGAAASAAYWLVSAAGEIVTAATGELGSIGVVAAVAVQEEPDANGMRGIEIVSSNAPDKRPDPRTDDGRATILDRLDAIERIFIDRVAANRGVSREAVIRDFGGGGLLTGADAVAAGMADRVGTLDSTIGELAARAAGSEPGAASAARHSGREEEFMTMATDAPATETAAVATTQTPPPAAPATPTAPGPQPAAQAPTLQDAASVARACNEAGLPSLASRLLSEGKVGSSATAAIEEAKGVKDVCAAFDRPELADRFVARGLSADDVRAVLEPSAVTPDEEAIDTTLPAATKGTAAQGPIDTDSIYKARADQARQAS